MSRNRESIICAAIGIALCVAGFLIVACSISHPPHSRILAALVGAGGSSLVAGGILCIIFAIIGRVR